MKNIFTRLLALALVLTMVFAFAACEDKPAGTTPTGEETKPATTPVDPTKPEDPTTPETSTPVDPTTPETSTPVAPAGTWGYDLSNYNVLEIPTSKATVYGVDKGKIKILDIWGLWELATGDNEGAVHAIKNDDNNSCIGLLYEYDYSDAKKVTLKADIMIPAKIDGANQNIGFVFHTWDDTSISPYYWETAFNNYYYVFTGGGGSPGCAIGAWAGGGATWNDGSTTDGWTGMDENQSGKESFTLEAAEFQYGQYFTLKGVIDLETNTVECYWGDQLGCKCVLTDVPFNNVETEADGGPKYGLRSNTGDVYFKNVELIIE